MIIADTCLVFHLFNETLLTAKAQEILNKDSQWKLPVLWREEYANVISKLARKEHRDIQEVLDHFYQTLDELKNCEIPVDTGKALEISIEYKISVYDAHFIALAIDFDTILVTEDKEILNKCSRLALNLDDYLADIK